MNLKNYVAPGVMNLYENTYDPAIYNNVAYQKTKPRLNMNVKIKPPPTRKNNNK